MLKNDNSLCVRKMIDSDEDYSLLHRWLNNSKVLDYCYCDENNTKWTYQNIILEFSKKLRNPGRYIVPCIVEYEGNPIGFLQYYALREKDKDYYQIDDIDNVFGIDIFIGEIDYWNKGLGTTVFKLVIDHLINNENVKKIVIDPQVWNERAIRCYEKCGFKKVKILPKAEMHKGVYRDCWLLELINFNY